MKNKKRASITTLLSLISSASIAFSGTHTVQHGETLWRISKMHKVSIASIQQANQLSGNTIELGQILIIPNKATPPKAVIVEEPEKKKESFAKTHTVKKGENLWRIARNNNTTMEELMLRNNLSTPAITVGQVISLSGDAEEIVKQVPAEKEQTPQNPQPPALLPKTPEKVAEITRPVEEEKVAIPPQDPLAPLPAVELPQPLQQLQPITPNVKITTEEALEPAKPRGLAALSEKQQSIVRQQILLDRNGMGPGVIDGYQGNFSKTSLALAKIHRPGIMQDETPLVIETTVPAAVLHYINPDLPGTGKHPDFELATEQQCLMMYKTAIELLAERYHCSEKILAKMNPQIDFNNIKVGEKIMVPNVAEFKIEHFMDSAGNAITYKYLRSTRRATRVDVNYLQNRIMVWYNNGAEGSADELLASFPVTTNIKKGPKSQRTIAYLAPAPPYLRKKTGLDLKPGPNSPVGIVWAKLGNGFGIHGTSDGSGNGYNTSSGCIRLSNWDMAIFVKIVPSKTKVNFITSKEITKEGKAKSKPTPNPKSISMIKP